MKTMYKIMGVLAVFTQTSYAVDAITLCASKGSVPYSLINRSETSPSNEEQYKSLTVPVSPQLSGVMESIERRATLDIEDELSEIEKRSFSSCPVPVGLPDPEYIFDDVKEIDFLCLNRSRELSRTRSFSVFNREETEAIAVPYQSVTEFDEIDFFESDDFEPIYDERSTAVTASFVEPAPRWIPAGEIMVTFTRNNHKEIVVWGGRFEQRKVISSIPNVNPPRCATPLTPVNQVVRQSVIKPGSRTPEVRLREAMNNCLVPIQFGINLKTREEIIKLKPRSQSPIIPGLES